MWNAGPESVRWISIGGRKADIDITDIFKSGVSDFEEAELTLADKELAQTGLS